MQNHLVSTSNFCCGASEPVRAAGDETDCRLPLLANSAYALRGAPARRPLLFRDLVERKLRTRSGRELIGSNVAALENAPSAGIACIAFAQPV